MADWEQYYKGKTWRQKYWEDSYGNPIPKPKPPTIPSSIPYKPDKDLVDAYQKFLDEMEEEEAKKKVPAFPVPPKSKPKPKPKKKRKPKAEKIEPPPPHDDNIEERQI